MLVFSSLDFYSFYKSSIFTVKSQNSRSLFKSFLVYLLFVSLSLLWSALSYSNLYNYIQERKRQKSPTQQNTTTHPRGGAGRARARPRVPRLGDELEMTGAVPLGPVVSWPGGNTCTGIGEQGHENEHAAVTRPLRSNIWKPCWLLNECCSLPFTNCKTIRAICYYNIYSGITERFLSMSVQMKSIKISKWASIKYVVERQLKQVRFVHACACISRYISCSQKT